MSNFGLVIHGGAGAILRTEMPPALEQQHTAALRSALDAGHALLKAGAPALDAVIAAVSVLEDCPLFNSAHGAVLTADGRCELDAALMNGSDRAAGAVAGVHRVRNPIRLAREIMTHSGHVMLTGDKAEEFARLRRIELVSPDYFVTPRRVRQLERARSLEATSGASDKLTQNEQERVGFISVDDNDDTPPIAENKWGTVGCVALDQQGHLAAGTSTGGMTNKKFGRVGDSPIIGAGTFADDETCAVSCTGHGEFFIRRVVGHDIDARMRYAGKSLEQAAAEALAAVGTLGGTGGLIAIDRQGNITLPFNTPGMYRGWRLNDAPAVAAMFG